MNTEKTGAASFIVGYPRSGTTLMVALLDNHPNLLVFPEECYYLNLPKTDLKKDIDILNFILKESALARLRGETPVFDREVSDQRNFGGFNYQGFREKVNQHFQQRLDSQSRRSTLESDGLRALVKGYEETIGKGSYARWLIKVPFYERHWRQIISDFTRAKIIYMLRDPREAILSRLIKYSVKLKNSTKSNASKLLPLVRKGMPPIRFLKEWNASISAARRIREHYPEQIMLIRYEDLASDRTNTMRQVAEFLNIEWNENLIQPSLNGIPWKGNSSHRMKFDHLAHPQQNNRLKFAPHQLWQIESWIGSNMFREPANYKLSGVLDTLNLKAITTRLPGEGFGEFIRNRSQMWSNMRRIMTDQGSRRRDSAE